MKYDFNILDINYNDNKKSNENKLKKDITTNKFELNDDFNVLNNNYKNYKKKDIKSIEKSSKLKKKLENKKNII